MIQIHQLSHHYGQHQALDNLTLTIRRGEIFGVAGHNGAGKSTLFKILLGLLRAQSGDVKIDGVAVGSAAHSELKRQIAYLPEHVMLYDNLSGLETLEFFARLKGVATQQCASLLEQLGLSAAARRPVREYSKGMRQRLGFAQALLGQPQLLILDEPTNGLDPMAIRDFYLRLNHLAEQGVTILISSHILAEMQQRAQRIAILNQGRLLALGSVAELREQAQLPVQARLRLSQTGVTRLQQLLSACAGFTMQAGADDYMLSCAAQEKPHLLKLLLDLGSDLIDFEIITASLEQIFFGFNHSQGGTV